MCVLQALSLRWVWLNVKRLGGSWIDVGLELPPGLGHNQGWGFGLTRGSLWRYPYRWISLFRRLHIPVEEAASPLAWWKTKATRFPTLAYLARQFLGNHGSHIETGRNFSVAIVLTSLWCCRIGLSNVNGLIMIYKNWPKKNLIPYHCAYYIGITTMVLDIDTFTLYFYKIDTHTHTISIKIWFL